VKTENIAKAKLLFHYKYECLDRQSLLIANLLRLGDSEVIFRSLSYAATCYYLSNHSKVKVSL